MAVPAPPYAEPADADAERPMTVDEVLVLAGGFGRYQKQQAVLNCGCLGVCGATLLLPNPMFFLTPS